MAVSTITITQNPYPRGTTNDQRNEHIFGTFALSQGTYPQNGYALNWGSVEAVKSLPASGTSGPFPIDVRAHSASNPPSGIVYIWDNVAGNLHIFICNNGVSNASGPLIEINGMVLPQWVFSDTIVFEAIFPRN